MGFGKNDVMKLGKVSFQQPKSGVDHTSVEDDKIDLVHDMIDATSNVTVSRFTLPKAIEHIKSEVGQGNDVHVPDVLPSSGVRKDKVPPLKNTLGDPVAGLDKPPHKSESFREPLMSKTNSALAAEFGIDETALCRVMDEALSRGGVFADLFVEYTTSATVALDAGRVRAVGGDQGWMWPFRSMPLEYSSLSVSNAVPQLSSGISHLT